MKLIGWTAAASAMFFALPVQAGINDPEVMIYRVAGVFDNGGADNVGVATSFHCTNFSGALEIVRVVVRDAGSQIKANSFGQISHLQSTIFSTHGTMFSEAIMTTGVIAAGGTAAIAATSIDVVCTAMMLDAAATVPVGIALHAVRLNPIPGTEE